METAPNIIENEQPEEFLADNNLQEEVDYGTYSKTDFSKLIDKMSGNVELSEQYATLKKVKSFVENLFETEKNAALDKFLSTGGEADDFDYKPDAVFEKFEALYLKSKNNFHQQIKDNQQKKDANLKTKRDILNQMRTLTEGNSNKNAFETFKKLQLDWKNTGGVPAEQAQELWSNYQAVINRFYDQRSIAFELLDLDRKRNLQAKLVFCEKAEKLIDEPNIKKSLKELEEIHEEFKHIGPVPKEQQEEIWARLRAASDKIHEKKRSFLEELKSKQDSNLEGKLIILEKIKLLSDFTTDKPSEWIEKTKEVDAIQSEWKSAGLIDKEKVKEINKQYWEGLKTFYNKKREFFNQLEDVKKENLRLKTVLCEKAEALQTSEDFEKTTDQILNLQKEWKTVGHVPLKLKDKIYERFKKACDVFFENKRSAQKGQQEVAKQHLKDRIDFVDTLEKADPNSFTSIENIRTSISDWNAFPETTGADYAKVYNRFIDALKIKIRGVGDADELQKDEIISKLLVNAMKQSPDGHKDLMMREKKLRKDIRDFEDNIAQFKNNMEFFARSKNAEAIRVEFTQKIKEEESKLHLSKSRLKILLQG